MKIQSLIPNGLSTLNLIFGFLSITSAIKGNFETAALFIIVGTLADAFDGKIARKVNAVSEMGKEFDSLADLVTFGVASSILIYLYALTEMEFGIFVPILTLVCVALRLARFNVSSAPEYFEGLPSPAFGFFAAAFVLSGIALSTKITAFVFAIVGLAMVTMIKYPTFKTAPKKTWIGIIVFLIVCFGLAAYDIRLILLPFLAYFIAGPLIMLRSRRRVF